MIVNCDRRTRDAVLAAQARSGKAQDHRTGDNSDCTLIVIHELNGFWAIHGLGAPGMRLSKADAVAVAGA
jgi:hypothetical protein